MTWHIGADGQVWRYKPGDAGQKEYLTTAQAEGLLNAWRFSKLPEDPSSAMLHIVAALQATREAYDSEKDPAFKARLCVPGFAAGIALEKLGIRR